MCFPNRLEKHVQDKEALERQLYSRFVMVLNEKKAKIRDLQEAIRQIPCPDDQQRDEEGIQRYASPTNLYCINWLDLLLYVFERQKKQKKNIIHLPRGHPGAILTRSLNHHKQLLFMWRSSN